MRLDRLARIRICAIFILLTLGAHRAFAWKPTTHQYVAVKGIESMPDSGLKTMLLANESYLRAGSMGPDLWYATPPLWQYSDLAHYCETDALAKRSGLKP